MVWHVTTSRCGMNTFWTVTSISSFSSNWILFESTSSNALEASKVFSSMPASQSRPNQNRGPAESGTVKTPSLATGLQPNGADTAFQDDIHARVFIGTAVCSRSSTGAEVTSAAGIVFQLKQQPWTLALKKMFGNQPQQPHNALPVLNLFIRRCRAQTMRHEPRKRWHGCRFGRGAEYAPKAEDPTTSIVSRPICRYHPHPSHHLYHKMSNSDSGPVDGPAAGHSTCT